MAGLVTRLDPGQTISAAGHFEGAWRDFRRITVKAGGSQNFTASDCEFAIFVISGEGTGIVGTQRHPLTPGSALTVGYRAQLDVAAGADPIELFVTTLDVTT